MSRAARYPSLFARLVANTREPANDAACWIWTGSVGTNRRPQLSLRRNGKHCTCNAAREMLGIFYVLDGEAEASHLCADSWLCINPDHLLPETKRQNMARRWGKPLPAGREWKARHDDDQLPELWGADRADRVLVLPDPLDPFRGFDRDHESGRPATALHLPGRLGHSAVGAAVIDESVNNRTNDAELLLTTPSIENTLRPCAERFGAMEIAR